MLFSKNLLIFYNAHNLKNIFELSIFITLNNLPLPFFQRLLNSFVSRLFSVKSFEVDFPLVSNVDGVRNVPIPEGIR